MSGRLRNKALAVPAAGAFFWLVYVVLVDPAPALLSLQGATMGTRWNVQLVTDGQTDPGDTAAAVQALLERLDHDVFSTWDSGSELSRLNRQPPDTAVPVSADLFAVLQLARHLHTRSGGAFDISVGALVNLWGFGPEPAAEGIPAADALAAARALTGLDALVLDPVTRTATTTRPLTLDLSGIAKGHAVDAVALLLQDRGVTDFLVEIGGELRLQGRRPDGSGWMIAVEAPRSDLREVFARIDSHGESLALAGSGDYRNFRDADGKRYSHEIDPRTGYPVDHDLAAVTVLAATAAEADAWATALMVLGPEEGPRLADGEGLAAYFIMRAPAGLEPHYTRAFAPYLAPRH